MDWRRQWHPTPVLLPGKSHWRRSLVGCSPWGRQESDTTERLHFHFSLSCIGEGNGNPLQCSCLENPRDGGAWWAAVYGVAQSRTRLKRRSSSSSMMDPFLSIIDILTYFFQVYSSLLISSFSVISFCIFILIWHWKMISILWPPDAKNWLTGKDPDAGKDWRQEEKGTTEDEMVGWQHWLDGHEFEYTPGAGDGQGSLACCRTWGCKEWDTTQPLNWTELISYDILELISEKNFITIFSCLSCKSSGHQWRLATLKISLYASLFKKHILSFMLSLSTSVYPINKRFQYSSKYYDSFPFINETINQSKRSSITLIRKSPLLFREGPPLEWSGKKKLVSWCASTFCCFIMHFYHFYFISQFFNQNFILDIK